MYKIWVQADSTGTYATNGVEYEDIEKAVSEATSLTFRWWAVKDWAVLPASENLTGFLGYDIVKKHAVRRM